MRLSRRDLLKVGLFTSAALALPAERVARTELAVQNRMPTSRLPEPFSVPFTTAEVLRPAAATADTDYYVLTQRQVSAQILPGLHTDVWGYNGLVPGPTIVAHQGRRTVMRQICDLPEVHPYLRYKVWTSTHLHGAASAPQYDGYAGDLTLPGEYKDYVYENVQNARSLWYHDHGVHLTATNVGMGLAAQYILHDEHELALPIPHGAYDVPLTLSDATFERNGQLIFDDNSQSSMFGDVILVNGRPWPLMHVEPRKYRFRILNAAVSRSFDLALSTGDPLVVIGTDGGLMPHPQEIGHLLHGNAERYEVVIDFSHYKPGTRVELRNRQPKNNVEYDNTDVVMAFEVGAHVSDPSNNEVPYDLGLEIGAMALKEEDALRTRRFDFGRTDGAWTINNKTWADIVESDYRYVAANPGFEDTEIWELQNTSGGWFHPVHIHLVDFRILDRNGEPPRPYELGPKDVAYVGEGEVVRVLMRFEHYRGKFMMHCHNLVHEDHDMMTQFAVGDGGDDPIYADPRRALPAGPLYVTPDDEDGGGSDGDNGSAPPAGPGPAAPSASPSATAAARSPRRRKAVKRKPAKRTPKRTRSRERRARRSRRS